MKRERETPAGGSWATRVRPFVPALLAVFVVAYEFAWRGRVVTAGSVAERIINLLVFLLIGPVMAWWGQGVARVLVQRLARSEAASDEKSRLLEQRNRQLQIVLQASRSMTAVLDLQQVGALVVEQVVQYTRFARAQLVLGPMESGGFVLAGAHGLTESYLGQSLDAMAGPQRAASPVEWCRLTRQPVVVENLATDFRTAGLRELYASAGVSGMIAVPLVFQDQFRGALIIYLEKGGPISTGEISLVSALASQAALVLENARLFTLMAQNRTRLDRALEFLQSVASALARTRVGVTPLLQLVAQVTARLFAPARVQIRIVRSARMTPLNVVEADGSVPDEISLPAICLPITLEGDDFGQFELFLAGEGRRLDDEEVRILQAFVNLTASALGSASLVGEMRQAVDEVEHAYMGTLEALTKALEMRDHETEGHCRRVVQYTLSIAQRLQVPESELVPIMRGALLHDVGKIGIPDAILKKPGPLTPDEWTVMRQHPVIGHRMLAGIPFLQQATPVILHHHERFDGKGYPSGLKTEEIPLGARIFAVADAYDAITSDRPYRKGRSHEEAVAEVKAGAGSQFDPRVVEALLSLPDEELARIRGRDLLSVR